MSRGNFLGKREKVRRFKISGDCGSQRERERERERERVGGRKRERE